MTSNKYFGTIKLLITVLVFGLFNVSCVNQQQQEHDTENVIARARAHTDLGAVYLQQKQFEIALEEFKLSIKIAPNFSSAYNGLALVNAELGKDDIADENFRKAIQIEPLNSEAHNNYGSFLCARNRIDESITQFLAAVKNPLYATPAMAYTNAAICSVRKNNVTDAEAYLQQALQIEPLSQPAAYQLASLQFKRKDALAAKKTLQNVMLSRPSPNVLWLAIQIERVVGDRDAESSYALQLRNQYPDTEQAKMLESGM